MGQLVRFGVSVEKDLIGRFDRLIARRGYANRCEALRDLMRQALIEKAWDEDAPVVATVTIVYDHHDPGLEAELTEIQHHHHDSVVAAMHSHLDAHDCLQVVILRGKAKAVKHLAEELIAAKGVKHGGMVMTAGGSAI